MKDIVYNGTSNYLGKNPSESKRLEANPEVSTWNRSMYLNGRTIKSATRPRERPARALSISVQSKQNWTDSVPKTQQEYTVNQKETTEPATNLSGETPRRRRKDGVKEFIGPATRAVKPSTEKPEQQNAETPKEKWTVVVTRLGFVERREERESRRTGVTKVTFNEDRVAIEI